METDIVIIGAGPNGLTAAAILAREGLNVTIVERNPFPGGLAGGHPGIADSLFAYAVGLIPPEVDKLLGLSLDTILHNPDPSWVELGEDGEIVFRWWRTKSRLEEEAREAGIPGLMDLLEMVGEFWSCYKRSGLYYTHTPPTPDEASQELDGCGRYDPARLVEERVGKILQDYIPFWAWGLLLYPSMYRSNGFSLAYYLQNMNEWGLPYAGMRLLAWRLQEKAAGAGARIILGDGAKDIVYRSGRATGVVLESGRIIMAEAIVYTAPIYTLTRLPTVASVLEEWEIRALHRMSKIRLDVTRVDYYLRREPRPPREEGWRGYPILVYWTRNGGGEYTYPALYGSNKLLVQASGGIQNPLRPLPPGVDEEDIILWYTRTRRDQNHCCLNSTGHPDHIPMVDPYILDKRPLPGWGPYKTSINGLYHGSASSYPGGEINLVPGVNVAMRVLEDLGHKDRASRIRKTLVSLIA